MLRYPVFNMTLELLMEELHIMAPGPILRKAREAKGLSQVDIANRLRLALHVIKALEADDYAQFAASVYVRGYLRAYTALLELDSEPLLLAFDQMTAENSIDQPTMGGHCVSSSITKIGYLHQSKRRFARWMGWIISIFIIFLLGVWWYGQHHRKHVDMSAGLLAPAPPHIILLPKIKPTPIAPPATSLSTTVTSAAPVVAPMLKPSSAVIAPTASPVVTPAPASVAKKNNVFHETFILESKKQLS